MGYTQMQDFVILWSKSPGPWEPLLPIQAVNHATWLTCIYDFSTRAKIVRTPYF